MTTYAQLTGHLIDRASNLRAAAKYVEDFDERAANRCLREARDCDEDAARIARGAPHAEARLHSDQVFADVSLLDQAAGLLRVLIAEQEKELTRRDLYPNVRDKVFKRKRALEDVLRIFDGGKRYADHRMRDVDPEEKRRVHEPVHEGTNVYKPLPPGILRRVVTGAGGPQNLRWPDTGQDERGDVVADPFERIGHATGITS